MDRLSLVILIICGNSVFNSVQRSVLCPKTKSDTKCSISNILHTVTSLICCASLIYILFFHSKNNKVRNF